MISLGSTPRSRSGDSFGASNCEASEKAGWGAPKTDRQVRYVFAATGRRGIGRPVHAHELRHLYVKTLIDGGVPVLAASKLVGHSDTRTTERWYYDLTTKQRRAIQERLVRLK